MSDVRAGWYTDNVLQQSIDNLAFYAAQGASQMLAYNCYTSGVTAVIAYLDEAAVMGIEVWISMRIAALGPPYPSEADWKAFINALKGHSATRGYYISDEPEYAGPDRATIVQYYDWAKEADPDHPVSIAHAWVVRSEYAGPPACYDIVLMDVYPNYHAGLPTSCSDLVEFNANVRSSYMRWRDGKIAADGYGVPIEAVALGFGYHPDTGNCQLGVRDLTDAEHRWHTHIAIVLGYDGILFWWDMNDPMWVQTNTYTKALVASRLAEISGMAEEMGSGTTNDPQIGMNHSATQLVYRYGASDGRRTLLAVNHSRWDAEDNNGEALSNVQFTLPGDVSPSEVEVLGEGRTIPVTNGTFTDSFTPFEVHIYVFNEEDVPAMTYQIQVADNPGFDLPTIDQVTPNTSYTPDSALPESTYYWRVRASDVSGTGDWSVVWQFTVVSPPPPAPVLSTPANGSSSTDATPTFSWGSVARAAFTPLLQGATISRLRLLLHGQMGASLFRRSQ